AGFIQPKEDWCDLNEVVFTVLKEYQVKSLNNNIDFTPYETMPLFKLDYGLLEQVIQNIIHNAIHHTFKGSTITIKISHNETHCIIKISDNGNGFPANK